MRFRWGHQPHKWSPDCVTWQLNATIENMADEGKLETPPPGDYRKRFWKRYRKAVFDWTVKTFWLRVFVLFAVPAILAFQQYKQGHSDWHTIWVTMALYVVILAIYMAAQLYFTSKKLDARMYSLLFDAFQEKGNCRQKLIGCPGQKIARSLSSTHGVKFPTTIRVRDFLKFPSTARSVNIGSAACSSRTAERAMPTKWRSFQSSWRTA